MVSAPPFDCLIAPSIGEDPVVLNIVLSAIIVLNLPLILNVNIIIYLQFY